MVSDEAHVSQLKPYLTRTDATELGSDEWVVHDLLAQRRCFGVGRQFLVHWRGFPRSAASWVNESELRRRCAELVDEFVSRGESFQQRPRQAPPRGDPRRRRRRRPGVDPEVAPEAEATSDGAVLTGAAGKARRQTERRCKAPEGRRRDGSTETIQIR